MSKTSRSHTPARLASKDDSMFINIQGMASEGLTNTGVPVGPTGSVNRSPARPPRKHSVKARPAVVLEELQSKVPGNEPCAVCCYAECCCEEGEQASIQAMLSLCAQGLLTPIEIAHSIANQADHLEPNDPALLKLLELAYSGKLTNTAVAAGIGRLLDKGEQWLAKPTPKQRPAAAKPGQGLRTVGVFFVVVFCIVPLLVIVFSMLFGAMMAGAEGWTFKTGFYYIIGNIVGLGNPLVAVTPTSGGGEFCDVLISVWSLSVCGTAIGVIANLEIIKSSTRNVEQAFGLREAELTSALNAAAAAGGEVDLNEFCALFGHKGQQNRAMIEKVFKEVDTNSNGFLDQAEVEGARGTVSKILAILQDASQRNE